MLVIEIPKEHQELVEEIKSAIPNCKVVEVNSLDAETITQVIIPMVQAALPVVSAIVVAAISASKKVKVKWNNIEITGTEKQVREFLDKISKLEAQKNEKNEQEHAKPN